MQFSQQGPKLVGTGAGAERQQGWSVSISADGNTAIVGGPAFPAGSSDGAARVWIRSSSVWAQQGNPLVGSGAVGSAFQGSSVAISADGSTALVGGYADNNDAGAVWVWTRSNGSWTQQGPKLVGSGAVGNARQGSSVSLSADGNTAIIGGPNDNGNAGATWVWVRSGGVWTQQGSKLVGADAVGAAQQASAVGLSADGNTAIIGGTGDNSFHGAAWIWTRSGGIWSQQGTKLVGSGASSSAGQGWSVSLSADGNTAIVGEPGDSSVGAARVWTRTAGVWNQQGPKLVGSDAGQDVQQGWSVSLSADGNSAIIGGPGNSSVGAAWIWMRSGTVWAQQGPKLVGFGAIGNSEQGYSVAISADGSTAIVGGQGDNDHTGAAWIFIAVQCSQLRFTVNDNGDAEDATPGDGVCATGGVVCTLRAAIQEANSLPSCGTIDINFVGVSNPINLSSPLPSINHDVNLNGPGASVLTIQRSTVAGTPDFRVFTIAAGQVVRMSGFTITGGRLASGHSGQDNGGGIYNSGTLSISNCTISGNLGDWGGAIYNEGSLSIFSSSILNNSSIGGTGAGIFSSTGASTLSLTNSTVANNTVGGGIAVNSGIISNSTISGNTQQAGGAGVMVFGRNGASLTVRNSTVTGNRADTGGNSGATGGGFQIVGGTPIIQNTIVAGNFRSTGSTRDNISGSVDASSSFNLIGDGTGMTGIANGTNGNQVGSSASPIDPMLTPLRNNGGLTQTHAPVCASPAIDKGKNFETFYPGDQRGGYFARTFDDPAIANASGGDGTDIGAIETQTSCMTPCAMDPIVANSADSGTGSLRKAIQDSCPGSTITFDMSPGHVTSPITLSSGELRIDKALTILGPGANLLTISGNNSFRVFELTLLGPNLVSFSDLTIANGRANSDVGGGIYNPNIADFSVTNCTVSNNYALLGGGIANSSQGNLTVKGSTISNNSSGTAGGIYAGFNTLTVVNSTITNNSASSNNGGGILIGSGMANVVNSTVTNNSAPSNGGGIMNNGSATIAITNSTISNNSASQGGGIWEVYSGSRLILNNSIVANNSASTGPDIAGPVSSGDYNLIQNPSGITGLLSGSHNIIAFDPKLGPLANNGGPTMTRALLPGSPAIDAGNNSAVTNPPFSGPPFTDQRGVGFNRIADGNGDATAIVDIGAYELQGTLTIDNVSPPAGRTSGGQQIVLSGAFLNLSTVTMGGASASWFYTNGSSDKSKITVTTPPHAVGAVQIDLTPGSGPTVSKGNAFAYLPTVFTDNTIMVGQTTAKAQHIIELRQAVDAMRAVAGLNGAPWTDPGLAVGNTIKAIHILDLRTFLDDAATRLGYATSPYTDPGLTVSYVIKRIHIEDLRQRVRTIAG